MIQIWLNGEARTWDPTFSLFQCLNDLKVNAKQVAVAKNGEVIIPSQIENTFFADGDRIEIFHAVGGG